MSKTRSKTMLNYISRLEKALDDISEKMNMRENEIYESVINKMGCKQACPFNTLSGCKKDELNNGICIMNEMKKTSEWISVNKRLPDCEEEVLVLFKRWNGYGVTTGMYEDGTKHTEDSVWWWKDPECSFVYDEETDDWIISEGWWEYNHFNPDEIVNAIIDTPVTHWMPLPQPPKGVE